MKKIFILGMLSLFLSADALDKDVLLVDVKKSLLKNYSIESKEQFSDLYTLNNSKKDIDFSTAVQLSLSHRTIQVYTNSKVSAIEYISVCSAVMLALVDAEKSAIEEFMLDAFSEALNTSKGLEGEVLGVKVSIVPDSQSILECSFHKK